MFDGKPVYEFYNIISPGAHKLSGYKIPEKAEQDITEENALSYTSNEWQNSLVRLYSLNVANDYRYTNNTKYRITVKSRETKRNTKFGYPKEGDLIEYNIDLYCVGFQNDINPILNITLIRVNPVIKKIVLSFKNIISPFKNIEKFSNPPGQPLPKTPEFVRILLKIANKSRIGINNPYYFNPSRGFKLNIIFNNPAKISDDTNIASCDAVITSIADGQQIMFNSCYFGYSQSKPNQIQLSFMKQSGLDPIQIPAAEYGEIVNKLVVQQRFDLQLVCNPKFSTKANIGEYIRGMTDANLKQAFRTIINTAVIPQLSKLTYTLNVGINGTNMVQDILAYEIRLAALMAKHDSSQEYTYKKMADIIGETLNEKIGSIVSPMFMLDNKINTMEQKLRKTQDAYYFNNLSNDQTNFRFYNNSNL
jgi:hypothetical protein